MKVLTSLVFALWLVGSTVSAGIATTNTITVRWSAPGDDGYAGRAYRYDIRYSTSPLTDANWNQAYRATVMPLPANPGSLQTCTITGLTPSTKYYFRMRTTDEKYNWSALSNQFSMSTCGGSCNGTSGNVDCSPDESVDISDFTALASYLFVNNEPMCICLAEANVDGDPLGMVDISDLTALVDYLYLSFKSPAPCSSTLGPSH